MLVSYVGWYKVRRKSVFVGLEFFGDGFESRSLLKPHGFIRSEFPERRNRGSRGVRLFEKCQHVFAPRFTKGA